MRPSKRKHDELRKLSFDLNVNKYAEGSCLVKYGDTHVLCTATHEPKVPIFLKGSGSGWVTAEYGMLPRSTSSRNDREAARGKQTGRTQEIQRLIGRSLRAIVDLKKLGEHQIKIDCDVIQADGGTRTAAISGAYIALYQALTSLQAKKVIGELPLKDSICAISCGIYKGLPVLDLDYAEDSSAEADANFVMTGQGKIVEIQGTAEEDPFEEKAFLALLELAKKGVQSITKLQTKALLKPSR